MKTRLFNSANAGMILFTLILIAILVAARSLSGERVFYWILSFVALGWAPIHLVVMIRTRNPLYLAMIAYYLLIGLTFLPPLDGGPLHKVLAVLTALSLIPFFWVLSTKNINWRYREILEMAARPVDDERDGFTSRPLPAGRTDADRDEVRRFALFLFRYVIVYPKFENERTVLIIPRNMWVYVLFFKRSYGNATHVAIEDSGRLSVRIAERDYRTYKKEFTFDQICISLAKLFVHFLTLYREGKEKEILVELNRALGRRE